MLDEGGASVLYKRMFFQYKFLVVIRTVDTRARSPPSREARVVVIVYGIFPKKISLFAL